MKLFVVAALISVCYAGRLDNSYLPPRQNSYNGNSAFNGNGAYNGNGINNGNGAYTGNSGYNGNFGSAPSGNAYNNAGASGNFQAYSRPQSSYDSNAQILRLNSDVTAEGFSYDFETSNGIRADASGVAVNGVQSQGSFSYKGDDGQDYAISYTADENGYRPQGSHLPTPPPIPEAILKSLEQNARDEAAGISDDGSYRGEGSNGYSGSSNGYSGSNNGYSGSNNGYSGSNNGYPSSGSNGFSQNSFRQPTNQYLPPTNQYNAPRNQYRPNNAFNNGAGKFNANSGAQLSRQYLTPKVGPNGSGNGNYNPQSGYRY